MERYFRVHTGELAYATRRPRGLFVAIGRLAEAKTLTEAEVAEYWVNRTWFEEHLPVPPFYSTGNTEKAITWFKDNAAGREMADRMQFYRAMASKYGIVLWETTCDRAPGWVIYEDAYQIAVAESAHDGPGFETTPLSPTAS